MLAHQASIKGMDIDQTGKYMVTTGLDRKCRVWDVRMYKQLHAYSLAFGLSHVAVSQRMAVACAIGNTVQIFKDMHLGVCHEPYLAHRLGGPVTDLAFVPYEDVLGIGHANGFTSMLVPGSGEANVDAIRANPYETKKQRREREVKQLLDKLQPELIALDPNDITRVNEDLLEQEMEERKKILYVRPVQIEYTPKHKMRGRGTGSHKVSSQYSSISQLVDYDRAWSRDGSFHK
ncbi:BING4CT domain protein [Oesophagostomum dentatum]|uniref:BING4CT domain protein n=1 Tax=Oesophagostomum dentatum TaxID=61180 RepID=A0A0B1S550_OESDE|nr:BING4CT domain protein [Oesophagostomum dentatum]